MCATQSVVTSQEVSKFRIWFQVAKVEIFGGFQLGNPTSKATASKLFEGESLCLSAGRRGSEYG